MSNTEPAASCCRNARGLTLIETLVAVGVFALSAATVGKFLTYQIRMASSNQMTSQAYAFGEQELEDLRAIDYSNIATRTSTKTVSGASFQVASTVLANSPDPNMKRITVVVTWSDPTGSNRNVTLNTIYTAVKR